MHLRYLFLSTFLCLTATTTWAQGEGDDFFDPSLYEAADDTKIRSFANNKVNNLSPSNLLSLTYDAVLPFDLVATPTGEGPEATTALGVNHNFRVETNYPVISKSSVIVNLYANYWQSNYTTDATFGAEPGAEQFAQNLTEHPLRSIAMGAIVFKPLNEKHYLLFQAEPSLNGNYNFGDLEPDFSKIRYSATAMFGWKFDDFTSLAIGATRTYRGGRLLHIPVLLYNKTFNERWGTELLLPARGHVRYNFSLKSLLLVGYELEGQTYFLQGSEEAPFNNPIFAGSNDLELRKSEIRGRVQYRRALTDFIWLDLHGGVRVAYRFDLDPDHGANEAVLENDIGLPLYFRVGLALVSP